MDCALKNKHVRGGRKTHPAKPVSDQTNLAERTAEEDMPGIESVVQSRMESGLVVGGGTSVVGPCPSLEENDWKSCTDEELEGILVSSLDSLYREAVATMMKFGYKQEKALKGVINNGHCCGSVDALTNIVHNAMRYFERKNRFSDDEEEEEFELRLEDLRHLAEYSVGGMVSVVLESRQQMSRRDVLLCLLMGGRHRHVGSAPQVPKRPGDGSGPAACRNELGKNEGSEGGSGVNCEVGIPSGLIKFGHEKSPNVSGKDPLQCGVVKESQWPKRFDDLPAPLKAMFKRNVSAFAAGFRAKSRKLHKSQQCPSNLLSGDFQTGAAGMGEASEEDSDMLDLDTGLKFKFVISMMNKVHELKEGEKNKNIEEMQKDERMSSLLQQIEDLEKKVEGTRKWAHERAMQAARKLSSDMNELKLLRIEIEEETRCLMKGKETLDHSSKKRFLELESALRQASGEVDRANAAVRSLENENAELRAEMEAEKLSASENEKACLDFAKKEKKFAKQLSALEKKKAKLQEQITVEKKRVADLRQEMFQVVEARKVAEAKLGQEVKAKDEALAELEELRRTKEAKEAEHKRRQEALQLKIDLNFQCQKDDLQRLEQELSHLKLSTDPISSLSTKISDRNKPEEDRITSKLNELHLMDDSSKTDEYMSRECIKCKKNEVSVVFLPCAHQVICGKCNETHRKKGKPTCPVCCTPIQQSICVFGASS